MGQVGRCKCKSSDIPPQQYQLQQEQKVQEGDGVAWCGVVWYGWVRQATPSPGSMIPRLPGRARPRVVAGQAGLQAGRRVGE